MMESLDSMTTFERASLLASRLRRFGRRRALPGSLAVPENLMRFVPRKMRRGDTDSLFDSVRAGAVLYSALEIT
jgi:hypothetical protein